MRNVLLCGLAVALSAQAAPSQRLLPEQVDPTPVYVTHVDGRMTIDTTGHIARYTLKSKLAAPLAEHVEAMVRQLEFEPVVVDGRPVSAETDLRVALLAHKLDDGGVQLTLDNVTFPIAEAQALAATAGVWRHRAPAKYPVIGLSSGGEADVVVSLHFDAAGNVIEAAAQQSALVHGQGRPRDVAVVLDAFEKESVASARNWKADPTQMPEDSRVGDGYVACISFKYRLESPGRDRFDAPPGEWTLEMRSAKRVPAWVPVDASEAQPGVADLADGEVGFPSRRFRLVRPLPTAS